VTKNAFKRVLDHPAKYLLSKKALEAEGTIATE